MKAVFKVMTALLACLFIARYLVCQQNGLGNFATDLQPICQHTEFSVDSLFHSKLLEGSAVADYLVEKYSQSIRPLVEKYPNSPLRRIVAHLYRFWYNVFSFLRLKELCCSVHSKLGPLLNHLRIAWYYLKPYTDNVKNVLENPFNSSTNWMRYGSFSVDGTQTKAIFETDSETEDFEDEDEDEDEDDADAEIEDGSNEYEFEEEQDDHENSQIVTAAILQDLSKIIIGSNSHIELETYEPQSLKMEYEAWIKAIDSKIHKAATLLDSEIQCVFETEMRNKSMEITSKLDDLNKTVCEQLRFLDLKIKDINCTSKFDPTQNKIKYFDETGQVELETYVTKSSITSILKNYKLHLLDFEKSLFRSLDSFLTEMAKLAESIRLENVEVYEEWGDIMVSQWSQRMAYMDIRSLHLKDQYDPEYIEENHFNWLRFMKLKKKVISERNHLVKHDLDMTSILEWITKLKTDFQGTKNNIQDTFLQRMNAADTLFKNRELKEQLEEEFVRQEH
ncbi:Osw7p [Saccharomyces paradoxus]|uniref:Osw7p n=1 Tax=Saccharomyces paradoxus TaxID=27291 RepID=A0A8B8UQT1_SACPA|nr:Osw7 [Saccharomyces paradoxus]QHS73072.1 Osw7 [Saccharomyces paradoxus]